MAEETKNKDDKNTKAEELKVEVSPKEAETIAQNETDKKEDTTAKKTENKIVKGKGKKKKRKTIRQIVHGRAYIQATYNNTIVSLTDLNGNVLAWSSAGQKGFKGPKKATPYAASIIVKDAAEKAEAYGLKNVNVFVKGIGSGRESAIRSLNANGLNVLTIKDITPIPHNGCRKRKPRKV